MSREKRNYIVLAVLLVVFVAVITNQFVLSNENAESTTTGSPTPPTLVNTPPRPAHQRNESTQTEPEGYRPLPLDRLKEKQPLSRKPERQIFTYYVPPPLSLEPLESTDPPPLLVDTIEPASVYAGTKDFTLRVSGEDFPEDAQIILNGRPLLTEYSSESELSATVEEPLFKTPGQLGIEVKDTSGELYSNVMTLTVKAPPIPSYKYVGRIDNLIFLEKGDQDHISVPLGQTVENRWRVTEVGGGQVVLEDVMIGLEHSIALADPAPRTTIRRPPRRTPRRTYRPPTRRTTVPTGQVGQPAQSNKNQPSKPN